MAMEHSISRVNGIRFLRGLVPGGPQNHGRLFFHGRIFSMSLQNGGGMKRCRFFDLPSGCRNGDNCAFLHPGEEEVPRVPLCRFYRTSRGCMFGESCRFAHDTAQKYKGPNGDTKRRAEQSGDATRTSEGEIESGGKKYKLKNGRIRGPPSHLGVPLPEGSPNPDKTPIKCGECGVMVNGEDELYNHYYINLIEMKPDHIKVFKNNKIFRGKHQCNRCAKKYTDYMVYMEHKTERISAGCYSHWKNLDHMIWMFVRRDTGKTSTQNALSCMRSTSDIFQESDDDDDGGYDEAIANFGYSSEDLNTLLSYGIKPWEDEADGFLDWLESEREELSRMTSQT